jgi:hypothetical protein
MSWQNVTPKSWKPWVHIFIIISLGSVMNHFNVQERDNIYYVLSMIFSFNFSFLMIFNYSPEFLKFFFRIDASPQSEMNSNEAYLMLPSILITIITVYLHISRLTLYMSRVERSMLLEQMR